MLKVVIIGYGEMFTNLVAGTLDSGCEIVGVFRKDSIKYSSFVKRIRDIINPSVEYSYIKSYSLPEIKSRSVNSDEFRKTLLKLNPDIILVGSWGEKISKATYDIPKIATINVHPSLLPKYRGPNPYFWAIRNQEQKSGVTFHLVDNNLDTGSILAQEEVKIYPSDTGKSLKERTVLVARGVVCELLKALREDIIIPLKQREDKASYYSYPEDLELNFNRSAEENDALIRASYPWGKTYFYHNYNCLAVNSYLTEISENTTEYTEPGTIVKNDYKNNVLSILCSNNKILTLNISLYEKYNKPFTKNYMKRDIVIGTVL